MRHAVDLERVETSRLLLLRHGPPDLDDVTPLLVDPRVARSLSPDGRPPRREEIERVLVAKDDHWERFGFGFWLLRERGSGEVVGRGGLQCTFITGRDEVEVGWSIVPRSWGQGLATELALASVEVAFGRLGLRSIIALTLPDNHASRRVMEKAGFAYERDVAHAGRRHVLLRRSRC